MCHFFKILRGLSYYVFNHYLGEVLTMAVFAAIVFATFFLENEYFVTFHEGTLHLANYFCSFNGRSTYLNGTVGVNEEDAVKLYGIALFLLVAEIMNIQELSGLGLELLSLNFYNYKHLLFKCL